MAINIFKMIGAGVVNGLTSHEGTLQQYLRNTQAQPGQEASRKMMQAELKRQKKAALAAKWAAHNEQKKAGK